jgi:hypothetical protein
VHLTYDSRPLFIDVSSRKCYLTVEERAKSLPVLYSATHS